MNHFEPYDLQRDFQRRDGLQIKELSEHAVITIWMAFWFRIAVMTRHGVIDKGYIIVLFKDWCVSWFDFMNQFKFVATDIHENSLTKSHGARLVGALNYLEGPEVFNFDASLSGKIVRNRAAATQIFRSYQTELAASRETERRDD